MILCISGSQPVVDETFPGVRPKIGRQFSMLCIGEWWLTQWKKYSLLFAEQHICLHDVRYLRPIHRSRQGVPLSIGNRKFKI